MRVAATIRWLFPAAICAAMLSSTPAGDGVTEKNQEAAVEDSESSGAEAGARRAPLRGSGFLLVDPRDSQDQIKTRLRSFFSSGEQGAIPSEQRRAEIAREVDALFAADVALSQELPEVSFEFRKKAPTDLFEANLQSSELFRQSDEVCPLDCSFRDLGGDSSHIHLTKPAGGPGDSVLVFKIQESRDLSAEARRAGALSLRRDWLKRNDDVRPEGVRLFGLRVTLTESED